MSNPSYDFTFKNYCEQVLALAKYPSVGANMIYPALKLAGEAGEVADKIGKHWRNYNAQRVEEGYPTSALIGMNARTLRSEQREALVLELGDCLWYIAAVSNELGVTLEDVARGNVIKLLGRVGRGTLLGEGDVR